jgi:radical SAM superfamily enzyme YgiQ (UPF0313 family)
MHAKTGLDLVLVHPNSRSEVYQTLGATLAAVEPPVWAGMLATFVRKRGGSVAILDAEADELTPEATAARVEELDPRLVAVVVYGHQPSASTQTMTAAGAISAAIKRCAPHRRVLLVGGHAAALPERTLREEAADFVCGGEGPYTVWELLEALKSGHPHGYRAVRGLWHWDGEGPRSTPPAPLVRELDQEMPGVAWDLLPMKKYRAHNWHCFGHLRRQPYAALYTTLGCPYRCSFCCIQAPFKGGEEESGYKAGPNSYRFWSPQSVVSQVDTLVRRYGVRNIKIADEMFVLNPRHVTGISDLLIERDYGLNLWAYARVDTVRAGMVERLKRAGFSWLALGIESGSERVRNDVAKRLDQREIFRVVGEVRAAGISVIANYIFGLPEDDLESMRETLDLALELNCEFANFYCAMAYPGSQLYRLALAEGWQLPERWHAYSQHAPDALPLRTKHVSAAEVLRFRDEAFQTYFSSPAYLEMIARKFGSDTVAHVREMAGHRLRRLIYEAPTRGVNP